MKQINRATINWNEQDTPVSNEFGDVYFSNDDALAEARYVFVEGNGLTERFLTHQADTFTIGETGFGSGRNFLVVWQAFRLFRQQNPDHPLKHLHFISVENYLLSQQDVQNIHAYYGELSQLANQLQLKWPQPVAGRTDISFSESHLTLWLGDISEYGSFLSQERLIIDAWFLDGFSPAKNGAMWSVQLFTQLFAVSAKQSTFATFTSSGFVRRNLLAAGFIVNKRKGFAHKREMLVGIKQ